MKKLIIIALMVLPGWLLAQEYQYVPFPDSRAVWSEVYNPSYEEGSEPIITVNIYERFALSGEDTVIADRKYKKLYLFYDSVFSKSSSIFLGGIREDSLKRVYYVGDTVHRLKPFNEFNNYDKSKELLLYDFSMEIGDTLPLGCTNVYGYKLIVSDIDTVPIGNSLRKEFSFNDWRLRWIEGIGSIRGLLFALTPETTGTFVDYNSLICFIDDDTVLFHEEFFSDCFPSLVSAETFQQKFDIAVCPNPVNGNIIRFEWGENNLQTIEIYNFKGMLIGSANVAGETMLEYPAGALLPGIYLYRATGPGGEKQAGKFVVQ